VGLFIVAVLVLVWSNWNTVKDFPVISSIVTWRSQAPLPKADPQRFAVALAHLEHDKEQQYERLIREVLKDFAGVQLLQFDRMISLAGTKPEESEQKGHARAQQYLKDAGAHVLIWGLVLSHESKSAPRLYWTTLQEGKRAKEPYQVENFKMPDLFWNDLEEVLRLVVATQSSRFRAQEGRFIADQLTPFITRVRRLLDKNPGRRGWGEVQFVLGAALLTFGEQTGTNEPLEEAVAAYRAALTERTRERVPLDWAATQNNLGTALLALGKRESGTARLEEAVDAYRAALTERTRERVPLRWAMSQNNLGTALLALGERESGTARLEEAVAAYRAALTERTRERVPLDWAATQTNLGTALRTLGERESGTARLEEAVAVYRAALTERTREREPWQWATVQNNLGSALLMLGKRESSTARLEEAVAACRAALTEWTQEREPWQWAATQTNLGSALLALGEGKKDATLICEALGKQLMAWEVFSIGSPYTTTQVVNDAKSAIAALKNGFDVSMYEACLSKHAEALKRIGLHHP
jgi:tetratricopeptide (TPR) repeat protein